MCDKLIGNARKNIPVEDRWYAHSLMFVLLSPLMLIGDEAVASGLR